jgi:Astacin (Peptidase family M12A)
MVVIVWVIAFQFGQMLYLIAQTLGLFHESQRYDRDNYITILTQNVLPENLGDLGLLDQSLQLLNTFGLPYDYASLMQFPSKVSYYD